jgi:hypothetical protein
MPTSSNRFFQPRRFPRSPSARDRIPESARENLEAARNLSPSTYRTRIFYLSIPRFTLYIRIILITAIVVLTSFAILLVRLDLVIEAAVLLIVLFFPSLTRFFAIMLLRAAEGLNRFYRLVRITFYRRNRQR